MAIDFTPQGIAEQRKSFEDDDFTPLSLVLRGNRCARVLPAALDEIERLQRLLAERDENIERLDALVDGLRCCETYYKDYQAEAAALRAQVDSLQVERDAEKKRADMTRDYVEQLIDVMCVNDCPFPELRSQHAANADAPEGAESEGRHE